MSVVNNLSIPTPVLNKRNNDIYYHRVRESQAAGIFRFGWSPGRVNLADLFTKTAMPGNTRHNLVIQYFLTHHHQLVVLRKHRFIFTWVHLSNSHTTRVVTESGFGDCIYTAWLNRIAHFAVGILLLHHYKSDLAHLPYLYSLVIGMYKFEI